MANELRTANNDITKVNNEFSPDLNASEFNQLNDEESKNVNFESLHPTEKPFSETVVVQNLRKTYPDGFEAVKGIDLTLHQSQIFVLIGHNGAGKSTTISMLTGMTSATEGSMTIFGRNFFTEMKECR